MSKSKVWNCPICGNPYYCWEDALDHIVKEHIPEYRNKYYHSLKREFELVFD